MEMSYASWSAEVQDVKHRILSYHLFMEQSGPRVSIHPLPPAASRLLTVVVFVRSRNAEKELSYAARK